MLNSIYNTLKRNIGIYKDSKAFMTEVWVALLIQLPLIWIMGEIQERASPHMNCIQLNIHQLNLPEPIKPDAFFWQNGPWNGQVGSVMYDWKNCCKKWPLGRENNRIWKRNDWLIKVHFKILNRKSDTVTRAACQPEDTAVPFIGYAI